MERLLGEIEQAKNESAQPNEIMRLLVDIQNKVNSTFIESLKDDQKEKALKSIWKFLLFAASHQSSSVRIASYRSTGAFLLKLLPYYPIMIKETFSDISMDSTIDLKSSGIIAASFAFISNHVAYPYLEKFLDTTPVFHHFKISDPVFSEHLSSIISNLGNLGFEWYQSLLQSFLETTKNTSNRHILKIVLSIIKHDEVKLMNEVFSYVESKGDFKEYLPLIAFILTNINTNSDDLHLTSVLKASLFILSNPSSNFTETDSAIQILSIKSNLFTIEMIHEEKETFRITLKTSREEQTILVEAHNLLTRPSFYLLNCPYEFCLPNETDGSLTKASKIKALSNYLFIDPSKSEQVLDILSKYITKEFSDCCSASLQGISKSFNVLYANVQHEKLTNILNKIIRKIDKNNWFLTNDILKLISIIPKDKLQEFIDINRILHILIDLLLSKNDRILQRVRDLIKSFITPINFERITLLIAQQIDFYNEKSMVKILETLSYILNSFPYYSRDHLNYLIYLFIDYYSFCMKNINVLSSIFNFLSCYDSSLDIKTVQNLLLSSLLIIVGSVEEVSGFNSWEINLSNFNLKKVMKMIRIDIQSKNFDVISEHSLQHKILLSPAYNALKFLLKIPHTAIEGKFAIKLVQQIIKLFPIEGLKLIEKYWILFTTEEMFIGIDSAISVLCMIQDMEYVRILCNIYMKYACEHGDLIDCKKVLIEFVDYSMKNIKLNEEQLNTFNVFISNDYKKEENDSLLHKQVKLQGENRSFKYQKINLYNEYLINDPTIIIQLKYNTYQFTKEQIVKLLKMYIKKNDIKTIKIILQYSINNKILINFTENNITFPINIASEIIKYLRNINSPEVNNYYNIYTQNYDIIPIDLMIELISIDSDKYLEYLISLNKITKKHFYNLTKSIYHIQLNETNYIKSMIKFIQIIENKNKLRFCMTILNIIISKVVKLDEEIVDALLQLIESKTLLELSYQSSICLYLISTKFVNVKIISLVHIIMANLSPISPEFCPLYQSLIICDKDNIFDLKTLLKLFNIYFDVNSYPSLFLFGIRIFNDFLTNYQNKQILLVKDNYNLILKKILQFSLIYPITETCYNTINIILNNAELKKQQILTLNSFNKLFSSLTFASFNALNKCLYNIYKISEQNTEILKVINELKNSKTFIQTYLDIQEVMTSSIDINEREIYALNLATTWLENGIIECDCYEMSEIIFDWCKYLYKYVYVAEFLPIVTLLFLKNGNRFFPCFVGVAKFVKKFELENKEEDKKQLNVAITCAADSIEGKCKAHAMAIQLMIMDNRMNEALKLAQFNEDCNESNALLEKIKNELDK